MVAMAAFCSGAGTDFCYNRMMMKRVMSMMLALGWSAGLWSAEVPADLVMPEVTNDAPAAGKRVRQYHPNYQDTEVHHILYLPTDWVKGKKYPVMVEYAGNQWKDYPGTVEGCHLGYGISGGKGVIWLCLPFVDGKNQRNATQWWGDVPATVGYCQDTIKRTCEEFGGDASKVYLAGFSRGAIACHYIGLHNDEIAALWRGFVCHSHYDGVRSWGYPESDRASALVRLKRLGNRPQFISQERSIDATKAYLEAVDPDGNHTFLALPFDHHTDAWVLRDLPERKVLRDWFQKTLEDGVP